MGTCGNAEQLLRSVDVLPGHASAIQATRGDGIGRLGGVSSKQLWQGSKHSRSACSLLAGDEGEPFAKEDPLDDSEEVNDSKRKPTHREGIVRWAPREPFDAGKSRGTQWLLKMSHCKASFSVACGELGACRRQN